MAVAKFNMLVYIVLTCVQCFVPHCYAVDAVDVISGVILPGSAEFEWNLESVEPAIEIAAETVKTTGLLPGHNIVFKVADSKCSETFGPLAAIDFHINYKLSFFLGPVCEYAIAPVARFSPYWNIPVITAGAMVSDFDNKTALSQLTRVHCTYSNAAEFVVLKIGHYNWTHIGMLYHDNADYKSKGRSSCFFQIAALYVKLRGANMSQTEHSNFDENKPDSFTWEGLLKETSLYARIVVLCASADSVREIMIKAHDLNFDNGEYVFFNIDLFSSKDESKKPWYRHNDTEERNAKAKKAYEALMTVTLRKPTSAEYKNFSLEVKRRAKQRYKNFTYGEEEVNSFVGAFHDAVILYAHALNETLEANRSITDGKEITRRMWNRTFTGITGEVSIDANGDRNADYSLLDMDPETGEFEVVANYLGNTMQYKPVADKRIKWAGGREQAPPDTPKCGFDHSKCPPKEPFPKYGIVIIVLGALLVLVLVAAFFIYRHYKLEAELNEMNWRVKWEDIMLGTIDGERRERKMKKNAASNLSLARTEDCTLEGHVLLERCRSSTTQPWCRCGQCEESEERRQVCCRHLGKLEERREAERCITATKDFQDVVLNSQVLLTVFVHVMLARRQRGAAPPHLTPYKCRLMAARQFLCWVHTGETLQRQTRWAIPACVIRAIKLMFPDVTTEMTSGDDACSLTLDDILPIENHSSV